VSIFFLVFIFSEQYDRYFMNAGFEITTLWTMYTINLSHENKNIECQVVSLVMKEGSNGCDCPPLSLFHRTFCLCRSNPQTKVSVCVCVFTKRGHGTVLIGHDIQSSLLSVASCNCCTLLIILITCKSVLVLGHLENGLNKCAFHCRYSGNGVHSY